jgi:hypothetical protein
MPTADVNLDDEMVKLVAYTIVSLKPDDEKMMPEGAGQVVVTKSMSGDDFISWMLAQYLQGAGVDPRDGKTKPRSEQVARDDLKYLRVYFVVSTRWPREDRKFQERQINALREIQQAIT